MLSSHESRMYAASLLYVYEGDAEALEMGIQLEAHQEVMDEVDEEEEEEEGEEGEPQHISKTKLIDFAHASFRAGEGADTNAIRGVENVLKYLKMLLE
jgi:inositol-polyphosphate multikinase